MSNGSSARERQFMSRQGLARNRSTVALKANQLDDKTFREIFMPVRKAASGGAGDALILDPFAVIMGQHDTEIHRIKRK
jgi:hypothetical protein